MKRSLLALILFCSNCLVSVPLLDEAAGGPLGLAEEQDNSATLYLLAALSRRSSSPDINVRQGGTTYLTGSTYNFLSAASVTFTIQNLGDSTLTISGITTSNTGDFTVTQAASSSVPAGGSTTFDGDNFNGGFTVSTLRITSNDPDEGTYTITTNGCGC